MARMMPDVLFAAVERVPDAMVMAMEKAVDAGLDNVALKYGRRAP
jgi:tRNA (guanine-N7-)-methyltransferase